MKKGDICANTWNGQTMTYDPRKNDFVIDEKYESGLSTPDDLPAAMQCVKTRQYSHLLYTLDVPYFIELL
jgi:hypothetical protein